MNCRQVQKLLSGYSAGLVEGKRRQALQAHVASCAACRQHLAQLRALDQLLAADRLEVDGELVRRIMAQVSEAEILRKWRGRQLLDGLGPLAAALSLGLVATVVLHQHAAEWAETLSMWKVDWDLLAQPQWAVAAVVGLPVVAGLVAWVTNWVAEELT